MQTNFEPIKLEECILKAFKGIENITSATKISQILFGVKGLTGFIDRVDARNLKEINIFFGDNHSDKISWFSMLKNKRYIYIYAKAEHRAIYKKLVLKMGQRFATLATLDRDFEDTCRGLEFIWSDKKRTKKFEKDIVSAFELFPENTHVSMVHDYVMLQMQNAERWGKPTPAALATLPEITDSAAIVSHVEGHGFKVLLPISELDLKRIGTAQSHCVGTKQMGYADKIRRGDSTIFAIFSKELRDGVCVEMGRDGNFIQIQGKHRRGPELVEKRLIENVRAIIKGNEILNTEF